MSNQRKFVNYYTMYELDREMSEKELKSRLTKLQGQLIKYRSSTDPNDTKTITELKKGISLIREAIKILSKPDTRAQYDKELDEAIKQGNVDVKIEVEVHDILEKARQCFQNGKFAAALKFAKEVRESGLNNEEIYDMISRSYYMLGNYEEAMQEFAKGANTYQNSEHLRWLYVRTMIQFEEYDKAQELLNQAILDFKNNSLFYAEQVYLYGYANHFELIDKTIKEYLEKNPTDISYRQYVAENLLLLADMSYLFDSQAQTYVITTKEAYERCLQLTTLANEIYSDETVKNELEQVLYFGESEEDTEYNKVKLIYVLIGIILQIIIIGGMFNGGIPGSIFMILFTFSILFFLFTYIISKHSYYPRWQGLRDYYRGYKESSGNILFILALFPYESMKDIFTNS